MAARTAAAVSPVTADATGRETAVTTEYRVIATRKTVGSPARRHRVATAMGKTTASASLGARRRARVAAAAAR